MEYSCLVRYHETFFNRKVPTGDTYFKIRTNSLIHFSRSYFRSHPSVKLSPKAKLIHFTFAKLSRSKRALAIPITFLILFVSMLGIISATYYLAVEKVNARSQTLKISTARQTFLSLDESLLSVLWQPGAARAVEVADSGGKIRIQPLTNSLAISISDGADINASVFNQSIGEVAYELPYSDSPDTGLYLRGDSRSIANQSGSGVTQLSIERGIQSAEIVLRYRPVVSSSSAGVEDNKTVNVVRVYVVNLNSSDSIASYGKLPLKISSESNVVTRTRFEVSYELETLRIASTVSGTMGQVLVPISSATNGAIIEVEIVECNVKLERSSR